MVAIFNSLDEILAALYSDRNRLQFLKRRYELKPEDEVANRIIFDSGTPPNEAMDILHREIDRARGTLACSDIDPARRSRANTRFRILATRLMDAYISWENCSHVRDTAIQWGDKALGEYAIEQLETHSPEGEREAFLRAATEIAHAFGLEDKARELLHDRLRPQLGMETWSGNWTAADICTELGDYRQAIDLYLKALAFDKALEVAREHAPEILTDIAQKVFDRYSPDLEFSRQVEYVESAEILGRTEEVRQTLLRDAERIDPKHKPIRFYSSLVQSLARLGETDVARKVIYKIAADHHMDSKNIDIAELFTFVGDTMPIREAYLAIIREQLESKFDSLPENILRDIEYAFRMTKDRVFIGMQMLLHERQGQYVQAALVAEQLGNSPLASIYRDMHSMVGDAKATPQ